MDLIVVDQVSANSYRERIVPWDFDFSIGDDNSFVLPRPWGLNDDAREPDYINVVSCYVLNEDDPYNEYGGLVSGSITETDSEVFSIKGISWRDMLNRSICIPDQSDGYAYSIAGDAQTAVNDILSRWLIGQGDYVATTETAGVNVSRKQLNRYCTVDEAIAKVLEDTEHTFIVSVIKDWTKRPTRFGSVNFTVKVVPKVDHRITIKNRWNGSKNNAYIETNRELGVPVVIALGQGELAEREVLYCWWEYDFGAYWMTHSEDIADCPLTTSRSNAYAYILDYPSGTTAELLASAEARLKEVSSITVTELRDVTVNEPIAVGDSINGNIVTGKRLVRTNMVTDEQYSADPIAQLMKIAGGSIIN